MIGEKINEFDKSDGTVESFNKIFPENTLDLEGFLEIGDIVRTGDETTRELSLYKLEDYKLVKTFRYDFAVKSPIKKRVVKDSTKEKWRKARSKKPPRFKYTVKKGEETWIFYKTKDVSDFIGISKSTISQYISGRWKNQEGYVIIKEENKT